MSYGSFAGSVTSVTLHLHCQGHGAGADQYPVISRPQGPRVEVNLMRARSAWLNSKHTLWQLMITWYARRAVDCNIYDDHTKASTHADPSGMTNGPYGAFPASVKVVTVKLSCINVAGENDHKTAHVMIPKRSRRA